MASPLVTQLAAHAVDLLTKLQAMTADDTLDGGKPNVRGAILSKDHQGYRSELRRELEMILKQLKDLGYVLDENGNPVPIGGIVTTYGVVV